MFCWIVFCSIVLYYIVLYCTILYLLYCILHKKRQYNFIGIRIIYANIPSRNLGFYSIYSFIFLLLCYSHLTVFIFYPHLHFFLFMILFLFFYRICPTSSYTYISNYIIVISPHPQHGCHTACSRETKCIQMLLGVNMLMTLRCPSSSIVLLLQRFQHQSPRVVGRISRGQSSYAWCRWPWVGSFLASSLE